MTDTALTTPATTANRANLTGWAFAFTSTLIFSFATPIAKTAILLGFEPTTLLAVRLTLTTLLLFGTTLLTEPLRLRIDRRGLMLCIAAGTATGIGMLTYFWSLTRLDSSIAAMIFSVSPLVVLALLALRGEKFTRRTMVRLVLGLGGMYLLIGLDGGPTGGVDLIGVGLASVAVFTIPLQLVIMQWYLQDYDSRTVTLYMVGTMTVFGLGSWIVEGGEWHSPGWQGWALVLALAFFCTYLARLLLFVAVRKIGSGQMGLQAPFETFLTVIWSIVFLHEWLTPVQWVGGLLILVSAALAVERLGRVRWRKDHGTRSHTDEHG